MFARATALQRDRLKLYLRVLAVSGAIGGIEIFLLREGTSMKRLMRLPFVAVFALKTLAYGAIVCAAIAGAPYLAYLMPGEHPPAPLELRTALEVIAGEVGEQRRAGSVAGH